MTRKKLNRPVRTTLCSARLSSVFTGLPAICFRRMQRRFQSGARAVRVATPSLARELGNQGIGNTRIWWGGVDFTQFGPDRRPHPALSNLPRPVLLSVGRVAVEQIGSASCRERVCQSV